MPNYECNFCGKHYVREKAFLNHQCAKMKKDMQFKSLEGQAAWIFYKKWMKSYNRIVPNSSGFINSKFFNSFINFAKFVVKNNIPNVNRFIRLMRIKNLSPTLWTNNEVYTIYIEFMDHNSSPIELVETSINTLLDFADDNSCDVSIVFDIISPNEVIQLIHQRKLSPWLLLNSSKFKKFFVSNTTNEEKLILETVIRPTYWSQKFKTHQNDVQTVQLYVKELNI